MLLMRIMRSNTRGTTGCKKMRSLYSHLPLFMIIIQLFYVYSSPSCCSLYAFFALHLKHFHPNSYNDNNNDNKRWVNCGLNIFMTSNKLIVFDASILLLIETKWGIFLRKEVNCERNSILNWRKSIILCVFYISNYRSALRHFPTLQLLYSLLLRETCIKLHCAECVCTVCACVL